MRSKPKLEAVTLARVRVDSVRFWPLRLGSFLYVSTSVGTGGAEEVGGGGAVGAVGVVAAPLPPQAASATDAAKPRTKATFRCMTNSPIVYISPKRTCSQTNAAMAAVSVRSMRG